MKLWVDDVRFPPDKDWIVCPEVILANHLIKSGVVDEISLDHDLGLQPSKIQYTGYYVLKMIEECLADGTIVKVPKITIHTANPVGRKNMELALQSIERLKKERAIS